MKAVISACFLLAALFAATGAFGQRVNVPRSGPGGERALAPPIPPVQPIPLVHPIPPLGMAPAASRFAGRPGFGGFIYPGAFPLWGDYAYPPSYEAAPNIVVTQAPPPVFVMQAPTPASPRSEIREYKVSAETQPEVAVEQPKFAIALRDGSVLSAVVAFVQGDTLVYVDQDGRQGRVSGEALDRDTTRRLNRELKLNLYLPPPAP